MRQYERELNKGMKVFSQLYVGLKDQGKDKVDLGFATPYEDNAAGRKRQDTVNKWAGDHEYEVDENTGLYKKDDTGSLIRLKIDPRHTLLDNKPRGGFKITDDVKRVYWGGGNVVWRVEDPAGFELEIQSQNLMAIIQSAGVNEGGVIPGYCMWGRDGPNNILLHEKSEEYKNAILAAEMLKKPKEVGGAERTPGTKYLLQDTTEGTYLGKFWVCDEHVGEDIDGWRLQVGSVSATAARRRRKIGRPVQFDAVLFGHLDGSNGSYVKLYKKAPLVREVGQVSIGILGRPDALQAIWNVATLNFASSSMKSRIAYIHYEKPTKLRYITRSLRRDRFQKKLDGLMLNERYFTNGRSFSVGDFHAFYGGYGADASIMGIKTPEGIFTNFIEAAVWRNDVRRGAHKVMFEMTINEDVIDELRAYEHQLGRNYLYGALPTAPLAKIHELPQFSELTAMVEWYQHQFDEGNIVEVVVVVTNEQGE